MAILATRRRWLVTSRCAASESSCSFQRFASMYSSSGSSIGNLRISWRYRVRLPSPEMDGTDSVAIRVVVLRSYRVSNNANPGRAIPIELPDGDKADSAPAPERLDYMV